MLSSENDEIMIKLLAHNILDLYNAVLAKGHPELSKESLWGLSNIACHSEETIDHLVNHNVLKTVQMHLSSNSI